MTIDPNDFDEIAKRFDKLSREEREEVLTRLQQRPAAAAGDAVASPISLFDAMNATGMAGSIKDGPADLSTNPLHKEGFGQDA